VIQYTCLLLMRSRVQSPAQQAKYKAKQTKQKPPKLHTSQFLFRLRKQLVRHTKMLCRKMVTAIFVKVKLEINLSHNYRGLQD
jgi:hypothetical protein